MIASIFFIAFSLYGLVTSAAIDSPPTGQIATEKRHNYTTCPLHPETSVLQTGQLNLGGIWLAEASRCKSEKQCQYTPCDCCYTSDMPLSVPDYVCESQLSLNFDISKTIATYNVTSNSECGAYCNIRAECVGFVMGTYVPPNNCPSKSKDIDPYNPDVPSTPDQHKLHPSNTPFNVQCKLKSEIKSHELPPSRVPVFGPYMCSKPGVKIADPIPAPKPDPCYISDRKRVP